jgi:hypothetical protein
MDPLHNWIRVLPRHVAWLGAAPIAVKSKSRQTVGRLN